jgi:endonuclease G
MKKLVLIFIPFFFYGQLYTPKSDGDIIEHSYYTLSYSEFHEQAEWIHYKLDSSMIFGNIDRTDDFRKDLKVITGSAALIDYKGSGYDRGHLAPAGDMKKNKISMSQSFLMSNMSPQKPSFNRGIWKKLESLVRSWAVKDELYITCGGVLENNLNTIGLNKVSIPNKFYKIVYNSNDQKIIAFLIPNKKTKLPIISYIVSVNEIEELTGIDFYPQIEDDFEEILESKKSINGWDFNSSLALIPKTKKYNKVSNKTSYVGKCNATTKKGIRCKRNASNGSRFCWQH